MISLLAPCLVLVACCATQSPQTKPTEADVLAAESLLHSALSVANTPKAQARAGRLVALVKFADELDPGNARAARLLAGIHETQGKLAEAAAGLADYLRAFPTDHAAGLEWLQLEVSAQQNADARLELLSRTAARADLPDALKAEAHALRAQTLLGQGLKAEAGEAYDQALQLDPHNVQALSGRYALLDKPTAADRAALQCSLLEANPRDLDVAADLAGTLNALGLAREAVAIYEYCWRLSRQTDQPPSRVFAVGYLNALLDAGSNTEAIRKINEDPAFARFRGGPDVQSLLVEAYRRAGQADKAQEVVEAMEQSYHRKEVGSTASRQFSQELAWFYLTTRNKPAEALAYARQAERLDAADPITQRLLGIAELKNNLSAQGEARLIKLMDRDAYAAAYLAEHYLSANRMADAVKALHAGSALLQGGPAFRLIQGLTPADVKIPPPPGQAAARERAEQLRAESLPMGLAPEKFLRITLKPVSERLALGEPVLLDAVLENISRRPVPLGGWGLMNATLSLRVTTREDPNRVFTELPVATWPAPRALAPGQSVTRRVRIDTGVLGEHLSARPLSARELTVSAMADPVQRERGFVSAVATLQPRPASLRIAPLVPHQPDATPEQTAAAYRRSLGIVRYFVQRGDLPQRMMAARQVGSLLRMARLAERGQGEIPAPYKALVEKPVYLAMLQEVLQDRSPCVRAEALTALQSVPTDAGIMNLVGAVLEDRSSLVRFRAAEMVGTSEATGARTVLDYLAQDRDPMVRAMVAAFR